jgi:hypothetical protein
MRRRKTPVDDSISIEELELCRRIANTPRLLNQVLNVVRAGGCADHRFDVNLAEGKVSEELVKELLNGDRKVEVKRQYRVGETGRVLIEYAHQGGKKLTGISTTEADWYALVLDGEGYQGEVIVFLTTKRLKRVMNSFGQKNKFSGRKGYSNFKLISLNDLLATDQEITLCAPTPRKRKSPVKKRSSLV